MAASILICGVHMSSGYSGGRYHAWLMGEALAASGNKVVVWTNHFPVYANDFKQCPSHDQLEITLDPGFRQCPEGDFDWVVIVPDMTNPGSVYRRWLLAARRSGARVALLNFESPNFFNAFAPAPRDPGQWKNWDMVSRYCDLILSATDLGNGYAKEHYTDAPPECTFLTCPPSVNSIVADQVHVGNRKNQILVITRFGSGDAGHKGGDFLFRVIGPEMAGYELVILVGKNGVPAPVEEALTAAAEPHDVRIRFVEGLSDEGKFREIKSSKLTLFFSSFEGFGYPPVESLYCDTPCISFDLPVLREVSGDGLRYIPPGDVDACRQEIRAVLHPDDSVTGCLKHHVEGIASFQSFVARLQTALSPDDARSQPAIMKITASRLRCQNLPYDAREFTRRLKWRIRKILP